MVRGVKICPQCNSRSGSAAKLCTCGYNFHAARLNLKGLRAPSATSSVRAAALSASSTPGGSGAYYQQASQDVSPGHQVHHQSPDSRRHSFDDTYGPLSRLEKPASLPANFSADLAYSPQGDRSPYGARGLIEGQSQFRAPSGSHPVRDSHAMSAKPYLRPTSWAGDHSLPPSTSPLSQYHHDASPYRPKPSTYAEDQYEPPMSAVRLYGLMPSKRSDAENVLFSLSIDAGEGAKQRCFVALELCNGAVNNDGHQCSDDKCRTKREPAQHPLSIAAILDLHCAHIEFCKKLRGAATTSPCDVTLEGYRQLVSQYGELRELYELGYKAIMEDHVPLLQRATNSVYVVYCGVTKESPLGFVHVDVTYGAGGKQIVSCECNENSQNGSGHPCLHHFCYKWHQASTAAGGERTAFTYLPPPNALSELDPARGRGGP